MHLSPFFFSAGFRFGGGIFFNQQNYFPWNHRFFYHDFLGKYYSARNASLRLHYELDVIEHDGNESPHIMFYCDVSAEKAREL